MKRLRRLVSKPCLPVALLFFCQAPLIAQEGQSTAAADTDQEPTATAKSPATEEAPPATVSLSELLDMIKQQQSQLDEQKQQLVEQAALIVTLQAQATTDLSAEQDKNKKQTEEIESQREAMASMQTQIDQIDQKKSEEMTDEEVAIRSRLETLESSIQASQNSANTFDEDSFPKSTMIPGTNAAYKWGGFVKMNMVNTFDPLGSDDRFIAGSIPVPQESSTRNTAMTVSQSRLNYELRDKTKFGTVRAYIEGDFAGSSEVGSDDLFRLRHAFGQFKDVLAGKTYSVFQDTEAAPEELDFEGINGAVNVRQAQIRYSPNFGQNWNAMFSLEDPKPEITGGTATSRIPDVVASVQRTWFDRWHIRSSAVLRQITAIWALDETGDTESQVTGWGISLSGKSSTRFWNESGMDNIMFQLNVGEGIGRYVNDLNTVGGEDAIFDSTGDLQVLPVIAGYIAYQHWWQENARSTLNLSWVDVDNLSFEPDSAYNKTFRGALNYIWSPTPRIDLGAELIYGTRQNKNGDDASATQVQLSTLYRF